MNDDELMRSLGRLAREQVPLEGGSKRTLPPEGLDQDTPELSAEEEEARRLDALQPLGADARARIVSRLKVELRAARPPAPEAPGGERPPGSRLSKVWWRWPLLAAAVAIVSVGLWPTAELPPMPAYELTVEGGLASSRAGDPAAGAPVRLLPGRRFALLMRPETAVEGPIAVRAFLGRGGGWKPWEVEPRIDEPSGSVRVEDTVGEGFPAEAGLWQVALVVGRRGELPDVDALSSAPGAGLPGHADWVLLRTEIEIEPAP